jgi:transposase InsO family protein
MKRKQIKIGRDALFKLLRSKDMLVRRKRKGTRTTYSRHGYAVAPNRIKKLAIKRPLEVLVGDITYLHLEGNQFAYLYLLTDLFSRRIVGYHLSRDLTHYSALIALQIAVRTVGEDAIRGAIHHTDRGCQYCCHDYLKVLAQYGLIPSMTDENHVYQNSVAERVKGILKDELDLDAVFPTFSSMKQAVEQAVLVYNGERTHASLQLKTPNQVFQCAA